MVEQGLEPTTSHWGAILETWKSQNLQLGVPQSTRAVAWRAFEAGLNFSDFQGGARILVTQTSGGIKGVLEP